MHILTVSTEGVSALFDRFTSHIKDYEITHVNRSINSKDGSVGSESYSRILTEKYQAILEMLGTGLDIFLYSDIDVRFLKSPSDLPVLYSDIVAQNGVNKVRGRADNPVLGLCLIKNTKKVNSLFRELVGYSRSIKKFTETGYVYGILKKTGVKISCWPVELVSSGTLPVTGCTVSYHANHVRTVEEKMKTLWGDSCRF